MSKSEDMKLKKILLLFIKINIYLIINTTLLISSYNLFNSINIQLNNYFLGILVLQPLVIIIAVYSGNNYKKVKKIYNKFKGLVYGILVISLMFSISAFIYNNIKFKQIKEENERRYDLYSYYINFDIYQTGYSYRIDDTTGYLYQMDEKNNKLIEIKPIYFKSIKNNYKFDIYKVDKGYAILNDNTMYFTKSLTPESKIYEIKYPFSEIKKKCKMEEYYKIDGDNFNIINNVYASEQNNKLLILYKKYNQLFYTKEKIYDLRIQMQNNFINYLDIKYYKDYITAKYDNKQYKIKYTFNKTLNVIYSKEEIVNAK